MICVPLWIVVITPLACFYTGAFFIIWWGSLFPQEKEFNAVRHVREFKSRCDDIKILDGVDEVNKWGE